MEASVETRTINRPGRLAGVPVCVFVSYSPDGSVKPHVAYHMAAIKACGFRTILVLVVDRIVNKSWKRLVAADQALVVRKNAGFDFGAWADAFRLFPDLWRAQVLLLVNDSNFGPIHSLKPVIERALALSADVVGLTETDAPVPHLQSFFILMKKPALASHAMRSFWAKVRNLPTKKEVIATYELNFMAYCGSHRLQSAAVFPLAEFRNHDANPSINLWQVLLERGYPYLKVELFNALIDKQRWSELATAIANPELADIISDYIARNVPLHHPDAPDPVFVYEGARRKHVEDAGQTETSGTTSTTDK